MSRFLRRMVILKRCTVCSRILQNLYDNNEGTVGVTESALNT
jgi:hypothetical protein